MLKKVGAAVGTAATVLIGGTMVVSNQVEKARRFDPAPLKDNGIEFAVLVEDEDTEAIEALNAVLVDAFCGGELKECLDTAEKSLTQSFSLDGKLLRGAQWTLTSEQLSHMVKLKEQGSLKIYRSRRKFQEDVGK